MKSVFIRYLMIVMIALFGCNTSHSQTLIPSPDDFINNLLPDEKAEETYKSWKGIKRDPAKKAESEEIPSFNVNVTFEYNSHELTTDGELLLSQLGLALIDRRLRKFTFFIGGHTDAVGSDVYNQELSEKRAQTVRNYLVDEFNITPDRLFSQGYGETKLLLPDDPEADANRRVNIKNIGPKE